MPTLGIIIVAGGSATRFGTQNKLLQLLNQQPVIRYSVTAFAPIAPTVLVVPATLKAEFTAAVAGLDVTLVAGGKSRTESVLNGLNALPPTDYVAIHDGARPKATPQLLEYCFQAAQLTGAAVAAHPVTDTIHIASPDGTIINTPKRETLWAAETPQVVNTQLLRAAYNATDWQNNPPTDEAALLRTAFPTQAIRLVPNTAPNPKITYLYDLQALQG